LKASPSLSPQADDALPQGWTLRELHRAKAASSDEKQPLFV
jgi:hypothetical protein